MKHALGLALLTLMSASCAPSKSDGRVAEAPPISVKQEMKTFWAEQDSLLREGVEEGADLAYGAWALLLANLQNAEYEEGVGREALPLFREWAERYPTSQELGESLWMLTDTAPDDESAEVFRFLEALSSSPAGAVARGALAARADSLEYYERADEAKPLLAEIIRRWPDSFEARTARRDLRGISLVAGVEAPAFTLRDLQGREVSLASLRGRVTLLFFFSFG